MYREKSKKLSAKEMHDIISAIPLRDAMYRCTFSNKETGDYASFQGTFDGKDIIFTRKIASTPGMNDIMFKSFSEALRTAKQIPHAMLATDVIYF